MHFSSGLNSFFESHDLYIQIRAFLNIPYKKKNEIKINVWCGSLRTSVFLYKMLTHRHNDLLGCLQHTKACAHMYADDTTIYASSLSTDLLG